MCPFNKLSCLALINNFTAQHTCLVKSNPTVTPVCSAEMVLSSHVLIFTERSYKKSKKHKKKGKKRRHKSVSSSAVKSRHLSFSRNLFLIYLFISCISLFLLLQDDGPIYLVLIIFFLLNSCLTIFYVIILSFPNSSLFQVIFDWKTSRVLIGVLSVLNSIREEN